LKNGRESEWTDTGQQTGLHRLNALDWLLCDAVTRNNIQCAEWLLTRGANPNAKRRWTSHSLHEETLRRDFTEMGDLLVRFGTTPSALNLSDEEAFVAACLRLDPDEVQATLRKHPEYLHSPAAIFAAAERDRADVVEFLLDLGVPIEIEDKQRQRPLHAAAGANALRVAQLLIDRGAEIDPRESNWDNTPLGHAAYSQKREMIELLSRYSRDVFELAFLGNAERLRDVLSAQPELAKARDKSGATPLFWVQDDRTALEIIELFLAHGADPTVRLKDGKTAADLLSRQGLEEAARLLRAEVG
jgi:ankyrin repeat protein